MRNVLCLDQATNTGFAIYTQNGVYSGAFNFGGDKEYKKDLQKLKKDKKINKEGIRRLESIMWKHRYGDFYDDLVGKCESYEIDKIYFEEAEFSQYGADAQHLSGGFMALIMLVAFQRCIPCIGVPVGTIKKHMTGYGKATKEQMVEAVNKRYRLNLDAKKDNDEADALALLDYALWMETPIKESTREYFRTV